MPPVEIRVTVYMILYSGSGFAQHVYLGMMELVYTLEVMGRWAGYFVGVWECHWAAREGYAVRI